MVKAPRRIRGRRFWLTVSTLSALAGASLLVLAAFPDLQSRHQWLAMAASFVPYGWICWLLAVAFAFYATRNRILVAPLLVGLAAHTLLVFPYLPDPDRAVAGQRATLGLLELNLRFGLADLNQLAAQVDRGRPDVVVLTEVTRADMAILGKRAWLKRLPHRLGTAGKTFDPATDAGSSQGTMVLSRLPLTEVGRTNDTTFTNLAVRVELPEHPFILVAAHPANPERGLDGWLRDGQAVTQLAAAHTDLPLVVAGDLNATAEHLTLRELQARAHVLDTVTGQGWHPTYPADQWYPPLIQIDHVLASAQFSTTSFATFRVAGTDHLGLLVRLVLS